MVKVILFPLFLISWCLYILPLSWFLALGRGFGRLLRFVGFRTTIVRNNLNLVYSKSMNEQQIEDFHKTVFENVGISFLEILRNFSLKKEDGIKELRISPEVLEVINGLQSRKEGAVIISAHVGNWELFASGVASRGYSVSIIAKKMSSRLAQALIEDRRKATGLKIIYTGGTLQKMAEDISAGTLVGFMVDQHMSGKKGVRVNFLGTPASSIRGLAKLVKDTGCKVIPMCAIRAKDGRHDIVCLPEVPYLKAEKEITDPDKRWEREEWLNTQAYQHAIEKLILKAPEQWIWIHRRWKANRTPIPEFELTHIKPNSEPSINV